MDESRKLRLRNQIPRPRRGTPNATSLSAAAGSIPIGSCPALHRCVCTLWPPSPPSTSINTHGRIHDADWSGQYCDAAKAKSPDPGPRQRRYLWVSCKVGVHHSYQQPPPLFCATILEHQDSKQNPPLSPMRFSAPNLHESEISRLALSVRPPFPVIGLLPSLLSPRNISSKCRFCQGRGHGQNQDLDQEKGGGASSSFLQYLATQTSTANQATTCPPQTAFPRPILGLRSYLFHSTKRRRVSPYNYSKETLHYIIHSRLRRLKQSRPSKTSRLFYPLNYLFGSLDYLLNPDAPG
ncbi:hypothetical protein B0T19DRAFT_246335 [Cercophora scortea]|uniref:Uncharacterized protein n=1 Tax=Cercophora scortea TaxID=314031 RepID=A0AAE0I8T2_9PEZI|nr:hypothetical protein B0T19DRAFT_246335 [Cercophora scortea]